MFLAGVGKRLGLIDALAALIPDDRDPAPVTHSMADWLRARILAIVCGYPDGNDRNDLRKDPTFEIACWWLPRSGTDLASQPTSSRLENAPDPRMLIRMSCAMVDVWCASHPRRAKVRDCTETTWGAISFPGRNRLLLARSPPSGCGC